jgi:parvulin-like peptidyl-prolyl isomerase
MDSINCLSFESVDLLARNNLLLPLIRSELITDKLKNITLNSETKSKIFDEFINKIGLKDKDAYEQWLIDNDLDKKEIEQKIFNEAKLKNFCSTKFGNKIESRFLDRKNNLDIVVYSLIRVSDFFKAREFYLRLIGNEAEFGSLAAEFSEGMEKKTRGIVGPVPLGKAHPKLAEHLTNSKPGEIQPPINIDGSCLVVRVESFDAAQLDDFMRERMAEELFDVWIDAQASELYEDFVKNKRVSSSNGEHNE